MPKDRVASGIFRIGISDYEFSQLILFILAGYRYRRWQLGEYSLVARTAVDAVTTSKKTGQKTYALIRALNEWDPKSKSVVSYNMIHIIWIIFNIDRYMVTYSGRSMIKLRSTLLKIWTDISRSRIHVFRIFKCIKWQFNIDQSYSFNLRLCVCQTKKSKRAYISLWKAFILTSWSSSWETSLKEKRGIIKESCRSS